MDNLTVIIRSVGERTEEICLDLLSNIFQEAKINIINDTPFTKTLEKSFDVGIKEDKKWTLIIDADVLVYKKGLLSLIEYAKTREDQKLFEIQGNILDKLFGGPRPAGNHLYNTSLLKEAKKYLSESQNSLRPETFIIKKMAEQGFDWIQTNNMIGLHDFEQSYHDIYRKAYIHAKKHTKYKNIFLNYWMKNKGRDKDFLIAIEGANRSLNDNREVIIDKNLLKDIGSILKQFDLKEKEKIDPSIFNETYIKNFISSYKIPKDYYRFKLKSYPSPMYNPAKFLYYILKSYV